MWRQTEHEIWRNMIIRALRRDVPNGGRGWSRYIEKLADRIEREQVQITFTESGNERQTSEAIDAVDRNGERGH